MTAGGVDHIVIAPKTPSAGPGVDVPFTVEAFDAGNNDLGLVTPDSLNIGPDGSCGATDCQATLVGDHTVTAQYSGKSDSATLTIVHGSVDHLTISPTSSHRDPGEDETYAVTAFDAFTNSWDATSLAHYTVVGGTCADSTATCDASTAGDHTVTAHYGGQTVDATLTIDVGPLDHISLSPSTDTVNPGVDVTYSVVAFDASDNSLGDVTTDSTLGITPDGSCDATSCHAAAVGAHTVTAGYNGKHDTASLTINEVAPICPSSFSTSTNEDTPTSGGVLPGCTDANNDDLTYSVVLGPPHGSVILDDATTGAFTYTPSPNFNGANSFTWRVNNGTSNSNTATTSITVNAINDAPSFSILGDRTVLEDSGTATVVGFANGFPGPPDESSQTLSYIVDMDTNSALFTTLPTISPSGTLTFKPAPNANGTAAITLHVKDNGGSGGPNIDSSPTQTFNINVTPVNDTPSFTTAGDQTVNEDAGAVTVSGFADGSAGPPDESSQTLTYLVDTDTNPALFSVAPAIDGTTGDLTFTTAPDANGAATITVHLKDSGGINNGGHDVSSQQTFAITVTPVNDAPSFSTPASTTVNEDSGPASIPLFATGSVGPADESGQTLAYLWDGDSNSALFSVEPAISASGTLTFAPAANAHGTATLTFHVQDTGGILNGGVDTSGTQTFDVIVTGVNDVPSFTTLGDQTALEDAGAVTIAGFATGSAGPPDESGQALSYTVDGVSAPSLFSVAPAISPSGDLTFTTAPNANGTALVTVHVQDDGGILNGGVDTSGDQSFNITITPVNDPPVSVVEIPYLVKQALSLTTTASTGVLANDTDIDSLHSALTAVLDSGVSHGSLTLHADGSFIYVPTTSYIGSDLFTYHAFDGTAAGNTVTVTFTVYVNHNPTAVGDIFSVVTGPACTSLPVLTNDNAVNPDVGEILTITHAPTPRTAR